MVIGAIALALFVLVAAEVYRATARKQGEAGQRLHDLELRVAEHEEELHRLRRRLHSLEQAAEGGLDHLTGETEQVDA